MSWFDSSSFTSLAYNALSKAQQQIDKVLDIDEESAQASSTKDRRVKPSSDAAPKSSYTSQLSRPTGSQSLHSTPLQKPARSPARRGRASSESKVEEDDSFWTSFLGSELSPKEPAGRTPKKKSSLEEQGPSSPDVLSDSSAQTKGSGHRQKLTKSQSADGQSLSSRKQEHVKLKSDSKGRIHSSSSAGEIRKFRTSENQSSTGDIQPVVNVTQQGTKDDDNVDGKNDIETIDSNQGKVIDVDSSVDESKSSENQGSSDAEKLEESPVPVSENTDQLIEESVERTVNTKKNDEIEPLEIIQSPSEEYCKTDVLQASEETVAEEGHSIEKDSAEMNDIPVLEASSHVVPDEKEIGDVEKEEMLSEKNTATNPETENSPQELEDTDTSPEQRDISRTSDSNSEESEDQVELSSNDSTEESVSSIPAVFSSLPSILKPAASPIVTWISGEKTAEGERPNREIGIAVEGEEQEQEQVEGEGGKEEEVGGDEDIDEEGEKEGGEPQQGIQVKDSQEAGEESVESSDNERGDFAVESTAADESTLDQSEEVQTLKKSIKELQHILQARESKQVELSKVNIDLMETNTILRNQIEQLELNKQTEEEEVEEIKQEFVKRIALTEKKLHQAAKERDQFKKDLEETEQYLTSVNEQQTADFTAQIEEKDEQINQLREEGEKLSKHQLQSNNIIKKLRVKEKENDTLIKKQTKRLEETEAELERLTGILKQKDEAERKMETGITQQNAYVARQEEDLAKYKSDLEDATEKVRGLQSALDNAYREMAELHKEVALKDSAIQEAKWNVQMTAKEDLRNALDKARNEAAHDQESLGIQITDLRTSLSRAEHQAARREDHLRQEIRELQQRLQEAEGRNQELVGNVTSATRPLLRQIENLQSTFKSQSAAWEKVEKNLTDRLNDALNQLAVAQEKERSATEQALDVTSKMSSLECQIVTLKQEKSRLEAQLEIEKTRAETLQENLTRESGKIDALRKSHKKWMDDAQVEKTLLEQQLDVERSKQESAQKKVNQLQEEKRRLSKSDGVFSSAPQSPTILSPLSQDEILENSLNSSLSRQGSVNHPDVIRSVNGGTALVERLQAQLQQKEVEVEVLQEEISGLERTRDSVTEELTVLNARIELLSSDNEKYTQLQDTYKELQQRHNAVLQMYGEKAEEAEELRMDLEDVKTMYRAQIDQLLATR